MEAFHGSTDSQTWPREIRNRSQSGFHLMRNNDVQALSTHGVGSSIQFLHY